MQELTSSKPALTEDRLTVVVRIKPSERREVEVAVGWTSISMLEAQFRYLADCDGIHSVVSSQLASFDQ